MRIAIFIITIKVLSLAIKSCQPSLRKEWRELSEVERETYLNALKVLKARDYGEENDSKLWNFDQFSRAHYENAADNHSIEEVVKYPFLPWHRLFIHKFEEAMKSIDDRIVLPYWDWRLDAENPELSSIFNDFGLNGNEEGCMTEGVAAGWTALIPHEHCLKRCNNFTNFYSANDIHEIEKKYNSFAHFAKKIEAGPHGSVHDQIGGDLTKMYSFNDPIAYLHHATIDKLWSKWQKSCKNRENDYESDREHPLRPFSTTVQEVMRHDTRELCYEYTETEADLNFNCKNKEFL